LRGIARLSKFGQREAEFADDPFAGKGQPIFTLPAYAYAFLLFCTLNLTSKTSKSNAQIFVRHYAVVSRNLTTFNRNGLNLRSKFESEILAVKFKTQIPPTLKIKFRGKFYDSK